MLRGTTDFSDVVSYISVAFITRRLAQVNRTSLAGQTRISCISTTRNTCFLRSLWPYIWNTKWSAYSNRQTAAGLMCEIDNYVSPLLWNPRISFPICIFIHNFKNKIFSFSCNNQIWVFFFFFFFVPSFSVVLFSTHGESQWWKEKASYSISRRLFVYTNTIEFFRSFISSWV